MDRKLIGGTLLVLSAALAHAGPTDVVLTAQPPKVGELFPASQRPAVSGDGRYIVFETQDALESADTNGLSDVYLFDRLSEGLKRIPGIDRSRLSAGPSISPDGRVIAFHSTLKENLKSKTTRISDILVYDVPSGAVRMVPAGVSSEKEGEALFPRFAFTDNQILFTSNNPYLMGDKTPHVRQVYLYDRESEKNRLLTQTAAGAPANRACGDARLSADGNILVFRSAATNIVYGIAPETLSNHIFYSNLETQFVFRINDIATGFDSDQYQVGAFDMDQAAQKVVFEGRRRDLKNHYSILETSDLFVFDASSRTVSRLTSGIFSGRAQSPSMSADGRYVAFVFKAGANGKADPGGLVVYDMAAQQWKRLANVMCSSPMISADGTTIVYELIKEKTISRRKKVKIRVVAVAENPFLKTKE